MTTQVPFKRAMYAVLLIASFGHADAQDDLDFLLGNLEKEPTQPPVPEPSQSPASAPAGESADSGASIGNETTTQQSGPLPVIELPRETPPTSPPPRRASTQLEEIVVTAQKRDQNLQDVPIAITTLSTTDIENQQINDLGDLASQMSSFHFGEVAGGGQASIRGVGFSLVSGVGEGSVAIHSDGLFLSRPGAATMLQSDVAGIEVLRGPQGTLYGRNATAGVINLITPRPPETLEFSATMGAGNFEAVNYFGHVGGGIWDGRIRMRASATYSRRGDFLINEAFPGKDQGGTEQLGFRLGVDIDATDWLRLQIRGFSAEQDLNGPSYPVNSADGSLLAPEGTFSHDPYRIRLNDEGFSTKDLRGGSLKAVIDINDSLKLSSQSGYVKYGFDTPEYDGDGTSNDLFTTARIEQSSTFTEELTVSFSGDSWEWLLGAFYMKERNHLDFDVLVSASGVAGLGLSQVFGGANITAITDLLDLLGPSSELNINNETDPETRSYAVFGDATVTLLDDLRAYFGLRYLKDELEQVQDSGIVLAANDGVGVILCNQLHTQLSNSAVKGRVGLQYDLSDVAMIYGQFSNGFKSGGFGVGACGNTFEPEELDAYELGFKSSPFDRQVQWNGSAFYYDYSNLQVEEVNLPRLLVENAQAEVYGFETDVRWLATEALDLSLGLTFLHARYTDFKNADNAEALVGAPEEDLKGNSLNRSPDFAGTFSAQYTWELQGWGQLSARGEVDYSSEIFLREFNRSTDARPERALYDAFLNWHSPTTAWAFRAYGKNLTDEAELVGIIGIGGYKGSVFNIGRTFGAELSYSFGQ